jgi:putative transposase
MKITKIIRLRNLPSSLFEAIVDSNKESARVWNFCKDKLQDAIKNQQPWPTKETLHSDVTDSTEPPNFNLHSQSIQQVCRAFVACLATTKKLRRESTKLKFRYPHKDKLFYPTIWTNQATNVKAGVISLPMGRNKKPLIFNVDLPDGGYSCRIVWHDGFELHVCQEAPEETQVELSNVVAAIDLGEIHQIACVASNGKALLVSGRGIRTVKHLNNKMLGKTASLKMSCKIGSKRFKKITKSRNHQSERNKRRVKHLRHSGTRKAIQFLVENKVGKLFVGNPDGVRNKNSGKHHNQRMSLWEYGKDIQYLKEKSERVGISMLTGSERGTSSTCPVCGARKRQKGRCWVCTKCEFKGHRDLVGATNIHKLAFDEPVVCPKTATYLRPGPQSGPGSSSRADTLQSSLVGKKQRSAFERWCPVRDMTTNLSAQLETHPL